MYAIRIDYVRTPRRGLLRGLQLPGGFRVTEDTVLRSLAALARDPEVSGVVMTPIARGDE